ncbi:hypothetical protein [Salinibaculum salinum]|uniref:hypothetical protein n=1 Tax=Salinibaculum salinum TaxID=3131996 RepID=UPI0030ED583E
MAQSIIDVLKQVPASSTQLRRPDFDLSNGTADQWTKIAGYQAETLMFLRPDAAMRLAFTAVEQFETPGDGLETTYDLANDIIETPNTAPLVLYEGGSRVQPASVDYSMNSPQ